MQKSAVTAQLGQLLPACMLPSSVMFAASEHTASFAFCFVPRTGVPLLYLWSALH